MQPVSDVQDFFLPPYVQKQDSNMFLLLDGAAKNKAVLPDIYNNEEQPIIFPLYLGTKYEANIRVSPILVKVGKDSDLLRLFFRKHSDIGLIIFSDAEIDVVGKYFRSHVECILPNGQLMMFRFYDPIVFYYFWPSLTHGERNLFMGPVSGIFCTKPSHVKNGNDLTILRDDFGVQDTSCDRNSPWFLSEESFLAMEIPSTIALSKILAKDFNCTYPIAAKILGKKNVAAFAEEIAQRNNQLRFARKEDLGAYMACAAQLGLEFENDPQYAWAGIHMRSDKTPWEKVRSLTDEFKEYNTVTWGKSGLPHYMAMHRMRYITMDHIRSITTDDERIKYLEYIYPEKARYAGREALKKLIRLAHAKSEQWGLPIKIGASLSAALIFFMGIGCDSDPLRPWLRDALQRPVDSDARMEQLLVAAKRMLRHNLKDNPQNLGERKILYRCVYCEQLYYLRARELAAVSEKNDLQEYITHLIPILNDADMLHPLNRGLSIAKTMAIDDLPLPVQGLWVLTSICSAECRQSGSLNLYTLRKDCENGRTQNAMELLIQEARSIAASGLRELGYPKGA